LFKGHEKPKTPIVLNEYKTVKTGLQLANI